ncbi:MAG: glycosyltransferase [Candidatus Verstraetearchaeota archaeon]|nr:glycosyltransferase [Candidatus Verstraetearchaeota archaeon]
MELVEKGINSVLESDYKPLEIIFVDNGSSDNSGNYLSNLLNKKATSKEGIIIKTLNLNKNYGFAGGNNLAFKLINPKSKYIALINNDLILEKTSLKEFITYLEEHPSVAGVQGKLLRFDHSIDSAGPYITTFWDIIDRKIFTNRIDDEAPLSYIDGAYAVLRISALNKAGGLFIPHLFSYCEDLELGLRLWVAGYYLKFIPVFAGYHLRGGSSSYLRKNDIYDYLHWRNITAIMFLYDRLWFLKLLLKFPLIVYHYFIDRDHYSIRGIYDGINLGKYLLKKTEKQKIRSKNFPVLKISIFAYYKYYIRLLQYKIFRAKSLR